MLKLINIEKEKFNSFIKDKAKTYHYKQSIPYAELINAQKKYKPHYLGLVTESNSIVAVTLLLEKKINNTFNSFYIPKGIIADYNKKEQVEEMLTKIKEYVKKHNGIFLKTDPEITDKELTIYTNNKFKKDKKEIDNKSFELIIPNDIDKSLNKDTKNKIDKANNYHIDIEIIEKSDDLNLYNRDLFEKFNKNKISNASLLTASINFTKTVNKLEKKLKTVNNQISILPIDNLSKSASTKLNKLLIEKEDIKKEISKFKKLRDTNQQTKVIAKIFIIEYAHTAYVISKNKDTIAIDTDADTYLYYEMIKYIKNDKCIKLVDYTNTKGFNLEEKEYVGNLIYICNHILYFFLVYCYKKFKEVKHAISRNK